MKNNAPKRKVFQDAVDLISPVEEMVTTVSNGYEMISIKKIVPFHNHPFRLYEGERLNDMVESIKENTVETCVLLEKMRKADAHVKISVDMDELNKIKENACDDCF